MDNKLKIVLPVTDNGVVEPIVTPTLTPEQIETKRIADEAAAAETARLEAEKNKPADNKPGDEPNVEQIEIDGVNYTLDAQGNATKADGTVHLTKAQIDALDTQIDDADPFDIIQTSLDFKPIVNGVQVTYTKDKAGLEQLALDAANAKAEVIAETIIEKYWDSNPTLKQLRDHVTLGGNERTFNAQPNWKAIDITTLTDEQLEQVVLTERTSKGDTPEMAKYYIDGLKKDGKLKEFAPQSLTYLTKVQTANEEQAAIVRKQAADAQNADDLKYWNEVTTALTTKKLKVKGEDFVIPETFRVKEGDGKIVVKTITDFNEYINKEKVFTLDGKQVRCTQNIYDIEVERRNSNAHSDIFNALRRFLKDDDSQLVAAKARFEEVKKIRKIVTTPASKSGAVPGGPLKLILPVKSNS